MGKDMGGNDWRAVSGSHGDDPGTVLLIGMRDGDRGRLRRVVQTVVSARRIVETETVGAGADHELPDDLALAIVDLEMVEPPAPEVLAKLRQSRSGVKFTVVASRLDRDTLLYCIAAGVRGCILRHESEEDMAQDLRRIIKGEVVMPAFPQEQAADDVQPGRPISHDELLEQLTPRQRHVLSLLESGMTNKQISRELSITTRTVKMHLSAIYRVLGAQSRTQALAIILRLRAR